MVVAVIDAVSVGAGQARETVTGTARSHQPLNTVYSSPAAAISLSPRLSRAPADGL